MHSTLFRTLLEVLSRIRTCFGVFPGRRARLAARRQPSSSQPAGSTTPRRGWPRSISWNRICRPYFGFLGVTDPTFLAAEGTAVLNQGQDRNAFPAPHLREERHLVRMALVGISVSHHDSRSRLGRTSAIVLAHLPRFPAKRLIGGLRLHFLALQLHSVARFDTCRVAGEHVDLFVFFID